MPTDPRIIAAAVAIAVGVWAGAKIGHGVKRAGQAVGHTVHGIVHHHKKAPKAVIPPQK